MTVLHIFKYSERTLVATFKQNNVTSLYTMLGNDLSHGFGSLLSQYRIHLDTCIKQEKVISVRKELSLSNNF